MKRLQRKAEVKRQLKVQFNCAENEIINNIKDKIQKHLANQLLTSNFQNENITQDECSFDIVFEDSSLSELNEFKNLIETIFSDYNITNYNVEIIM